MRQESPVDQRSVIAVAFLIGGSRRCVAHQLRSCDLETERSPTGHRRRTRMLSFRSLQEIQRAVEKHLAWATADEQFRANHMETTAGLPGVTGDWVPSKDFDLIFSTSRRLLRERICTTSSAQIVSLR